MKKMNKKEIENEIEKYFGGRKYKADIEMLGSLAEITLCYEDFKPSRQVRRELEELIPNVDNIEISRDYSPRSSRLAFYLVISEHPVMYVKEMGEYKEIRLAEVVNEMLFSKDLG